MNRARRKSRGAHAGVEHQPLKAPMDAAQPASPKASARPPRPRGWRIFLSIFKWCRVSVWIAILLLVVLHLFLHRVGVPEWVKVRIIAQMRAQGWEMNFSRLRLQWYRGVVADGLLLSRTNTISGPNLFVESAEFRLNFRALRHFDLHADSVLVQGGRMVWPLPGTNHPQQTLDLTRLQGELLFRPDDSWELRSLEGRAFGAHIRIRGEATNASLIRDWKMPKPPTKPRAPDERPVWSRLIEYGGKVKFAGTPELTVIFSLDAADVRSLDVNARFSAQAFESPWVGGTNFGVAARLRPPLATNDPLRVELTVTADTPHSPWGGATNLLFALKAEPSFTQLFPTNGSAVLQLQGAQTPWGGAQSLLVSLFSEPSVTNEAWRLTQWRVVGEQLRSEWFSAHHLEVESHFLHPATNYLPAIAASLSAEARRARSVAGTSDWARAEVQFELPAAVQTLLADTNLPWTDRLRRVPALVTVSLSNTHAFHLAAPRVAITNRWDWPRLEAAGVATLTNGDLTWKGTFNTPSRDLALNLQARVDPTAVAPFFGTNTPPWLNEVRAEKPPRIEAAIRARFPEWTNAAAAWADEMLSTLSIAGSLELGRATVREVPLDGARALFLFTNSTLTVPELRVTRPEGGIVAELQLDHRSGDFLARVNDCRIDPRAVRPLLDKDGREGLDDFVFKELPSLRAEVRGNLQKLEHIGVTAQVSASNVTYRGQSVRWVESGLTYTNEFLSFIQPRVLRDAGEHAEGDGVGIDLRRHRLYLTNATGRVTPMDLARVINDDVERVLAPFRFDHPPEARAHGVICLRKREHNNDVTFEVNGGTFHWLQFNLESARGTVHWLGDAVLITNLVGRWKGGDTTGWAALNFPPGAPDTMAFFMKLEGADLHQVMLDLQPGKTNRLEGGWSGELTITHAQLDDWKSWQGFGHSSLTNGLIWDIPLFGVASQFLNAIPTPGMKLGNSRAKEAHMDFLITNSVIISENLEIRTGITRLRYEGSVDFEHRVDGRMEAELLRNIPGVGWLVSKVLFPVSKLFEYRITGTLDDPKTRPTYVLPSIILMPLQPVKSLKEIFGEPEKKPADAREPKADGDK